MIGNYNNYVILLKVIKAITITGALCLGLIFLCCSHIGHRARVKKGVNVSVLVAPSRETYDPPGTHWSRTGYAGNDFSEQGRTDIQISSGYAWKLRNNRKLMVQANFALADGYYFPSTGLYYQATTDDLPVAAGIGVIIGQDPLLYLLWGRDFSNCSDCPTGAGLDIGLGFGTGASYLVDARFFYRFGNIQLGAFTEYRYYRNVLVLCTENCDYDSYLKSRWSFGVIFIP